MAFGWGGWGDKRAHWRLHYKLIDLICRILRVVAYTFSQNKLRLNHLHLSADYWWEKKGTHYSSGENNRYQP